MIQAWALEQETDSKRKFEDQNVLVPWKLQSKFSAGGDDKNEEGGNRGNTGSPMVFQRFCHVYTEGELENLMHR